MGQGLSTIDYINLEETLPVTPPFRYIFFVRIFCSGFLHIFFVHAFGVSFAYLKLYHCIS